MTNSAENGAAGSSQPDLRLDAAGRLVLTEADGTGHSDVIPVRAFPLSDPEHWISLCDATGRELACIEHPDSLPAPVRRVLADALAKREFLPVLTRIVSVSGETEPSEWEVETDRGPTRFMLRSAEDIRRLSPNRLMIVDTNGLRYLLADVEHLDRATRRLLARFL